MTRRLSQHRRPSRRCRIKARRKLLDHQPALSLHVSHPTHLSKSPSLQSIEATLRTVPRHPRWPLDWISDFKRQRQARRSLLPSNLRFSSLPPSTSSLITLAGVAQSVERVALINSKEINLKVVGSSPTFGYSYIQVFP